MEDYKEWVANEVYDNNALLITKDKKYEGGFRCFSMGPHTISAPGKTIKEALDKWIEIEESAKITSAWHKENEGKKAVFTPVEGEEKLWRLHYEGGTPHP